MLPGWRYRRWRRRRAMSWLMLLMVAVLVLALCATRVERPRAVYLETHTFGIVGR